MSEFVECQNCGRKFFAENIDCPYCSDGQELQDLMDEVQGKKRPSSPMFSILFSSFRVVLGGIALFSLLAVARTPIAVTRMILILEAGLALLLLVGIVQRRRWARIMAVVFIFGNAALGVWSLVQRGQTSSLVWGPGPLALLVFLIPFLSSRSRDYFIR